ncbi:BgtAcSP-31344 [Blumeria graminis f. sp. tritici]|uniref:BgtAcSP-31344 n=2 Tax=Blumeria graminis f. sp. tritici TaxID=62690 RepID=A0A9X9MJU4_BLUGR|nr:hypothetical protein BGT96224_AcSP31344 [Blumeria graminis f. sp. tritici 96224]VDB90467.1 BgtAcSP-31344 [Blumeria graminis f. sp. tritici]
MRSIAPIGLFLLNFVFPVSTTSEEEKVFQCTDNGSRVTFDYSKFEYVRSEACSHINISTRGDNYLNSEDPSSYTYEFRNEYLTQHLDEHYTDDYFFFFKNNPEKLTYNKNLLKMFKFYIREIYHENVNSELTPQVKRYYLVIDQKCSSVAVVMVWNFLIANPSRVRKSEAFFERRKYCPIQLPMPYYS